MTKFWRSQSALICACLVLTGSALAKPHDIQIDQVDLLPAIHTPTGCLAKIEYHDGDFAGAFITDPLCLPVGVSKQPIPSTAMDFYVLRASEARLTGQ